MEVYQRAMQTDSSHEKAAKKHCHDWQLSCIDDLQQGFCWWVPMAAAQPENQFLVWVGDDDYYLIDYYRLSMIAMR